jgi:hypothetical protein
MRGAFSTVPNKIVQSLNYQSELRYSFYVIAGENSRTTY